MQKKGFKGLRVQKFRVQRFRVQGFRTQKIIRKHEARNRLKVVLSEAKELVKFNDG
jgi:hypothetical protein